MSPRIQNAINIFLDALNEGTLIKGDCTKCAIGNLVRIGCGYSNEEYQTHKLKKTPRGGYINWSMVFTTNSGIQSFKRRTYLRIFEKYPEVKRQIESTDFTLEELAKIEKAFERNTRFFYRDDATPENVRKDQIRGLEAVIKVMLEFDEQKDNVEEVFTEKAKLIEV